MSNDGNNPPTDSNESLVHIRLDSWKEIAAHLNRDIRTVQLWEKREDLPIHRQAHTARASVFAFTHELDIWQNARRTQPAPVVASFPAPDSASYSPRSGFLQKHATALITLTAVALAAILLAAAFYRNVVRVNIRAAFRDKTLAVLPFQDHSPEPRESYLAIGLTDDLITDIGRSGLVHVISISPEPAAQPDNRGAHPQSALDSHADLVIEGTVMRLGQQVRVTVRLIDATSGRDLWAEAYKESSADILSAQDDIAGAIASSVVAKLSGSATHSDRPLSITH